MTTTANYTKMIVIRFILSLTSIIFSFIISAILIFPQNLLAGEIPDGYKGAKFGMGYDEAKKAAIEEGMIIIEEHKEKKGDIDTGFLATPPSKMIEGEIIGEDVKIFYFYFVTPISKQLWTVKIECYSKDKNLYNKIKDILVKKYNLPSKSKETIGTRKDTWAFKDNTIFIIMEEEASGKILVFYSSKEFLDKNIKEVKEVEEERKKEAYKLNEEATKLIQEGKNYEGFVLLKKAIQIYAEDPFLHMNCGSAIFSETQISAQKGNKKEAALFAKEAEKELLLAVDLFKKKNPKGADLLQSHCYYLLGDIYNYVFEDKEKAKELYKYSLQHNPEHPGAVKEIKEFGK